MIIKQVNVLGSTVNVREEREQQDMDVVNEVLVSDCYNLGPMQKQDFKTFMDIGGHIGTFSLLVKKIWPEAKIMGFEPNAFSYNLYARNIIDNNLRDITVYNYAVNGKSENVVLLDGAGSTGGGSLVSKEEAERIINNHVEGQETYTIFNNNVTQISFDEALKLFKEKFGTDTIDILKLDCEGSELDILETITPEAASKVNAILGEFHKTPFINFKYLLESKFPHLTVRGEDRGKIGPFWAFKKN
jgi:FkbM family methyltransferase